MKANDRTYSNYAEPQAIEMLDALLTSESSQSYRDTMASLGRQLGQLAAQKINTRIGCLVVSTAEDADFLTKGVLDALKTQCNPFVAVFWNNHYRTTTGMSVAPVIHRYLQPGFESAEELVVVKSVISGSCVVRTNILALVERINAKKIYILSPVMHENAESLLRNEFPESISSLFEFIYFAKDSIKNDDGEVKPGIGGQVYNLLGLNDQPAKTSYMPALVRTLAAI